MKTMKKVSVCLLAMLLTFAVLTGCETSLAFTYNIDNGDAIKVSLNTSDKYKISSDVPFEISQDGNVLTQGSFIQGEFYEQFIAAIEADEHSKIYDSGVKDGNKYTYWISGDLEYCYVILVEDSNTGVVLVNTVSPDSAMECFNRLTITSEN